MMELPTRHPLIRPITLNGLRELYFGVYTFEVEATSWWWLPRYKGAAWYDSLGKALQLVDRNEPHTGGHAYLFDTEIDAATARALRMGQSAPPPFILDPPLLDHTQVLPGTRCTFTLTLIGAGMAMFPLFVSAFERMGREIGVGDQRDPRDGRFRIMQVVDHAGTVLYRHLGGLTGTVETRLRTADFVRDEATPDRVMLRFLTPILVKTRFRRQQTELLMLHKGSDVFALIDAQYRRLFHLTQLYCRPARKRVRPYEPINFGKRTPVLLKAGVQWEDAEHDVNRQKDVMKLEGFMGEVTLRGTDIVAYLPLLWLGEYLHVGKGTTCGLGKYEVWRR